VRRECCGIRELQLLAAAFLDLLGAQIPDELLYTVSGDTQALVEERKEEIDWLGSDFLGGFRRVHTA
jgi:hypothetical protein